MKFGRAHLAFTGAVAALGALALACAAPVPDATLAATLAALAFALVAPRAWSAHRHAGALLATALVVIETARFALGSAAIDVVVELLLGLQVVAVGTRRDASHDFAIFVLALLHLLTATAFGGGPLVALAFLALSVVLPATLMLSHLRREVEHNYDHGARDRVGRPVDVPRILGSRRVIGRGFFAAMGVLAVPLLAGAMLVFAVAPRLAPLPPTTSSWPFDLGAYAGLVRFSASVDLSARGALRFDRAVAFRFRLATAPATGPSSAPSNMPARLPLRFRAAALESFDGRTWQRTEDPFSVASITSAPRAIAVDQAGFEPPVAYVPEGAFFPEVLSPRRRARDLSTPRLSTRVRALAHTWADEAGESHADRARAIARHLKTELAYDLASPSRGQSDPLDHFLFESKRGHCELFASAMAVMVREIGIPSRVVTGFVGGDYNRFGDFYAVRQRDAHAWVEAYVDGGWQTFDPTPTGVASGARSIFSPIHELAEAAGDRARHGVDPSGPQVEPWTSFLAGVLALLLLAGLPAVLHWRSRRGRTPGPSIPSLAAGGPSGAASLYASLDAAFEKLGIARDPATPPLSHAETLARERHPLAHEIVDLTRVYLDARFGGQALDSRGRREFRRRVAALAYPTRRITKAT